MVIIHMLVLLYLKEFQSDIYFKYIAAKHLDILSVIEIVIWIAAFIPAAIITYFIEKKFKFYNLGMFDD